ncbi:hypothetical protein Salat_2089700 [Sesamum alatum]|uniref:Uncharacterized protein n=1 Tax=Sesamum alatum TaxID=300844 RepID=A0AAE1Y188_9LAMI|nr:hypothetical protein Salat_2089700 [Sesamum alatum]
MFVGATGSFLFWGRGGGNYTSDRDFSPFMVSIILSAALAPLSADPCSSDFEGPPFPQASSPLASSSPPFRPRHPWPLYLLFAVLVILAASFRTSLPWPRYLLFESFVVLASLSSPRPSSLVILFLSPRSSSLVILYFRLRYCDLVIFSSFLLFFPYQ